MRNAGEYIIDGTTRVENLNNTVHIGYGTRVSATGVTNENVFGFEAEGKGNNTVTLGNSDVEDIYTDGTYNTSNASPLGSAPGGTNITAGLVLTANGSGGSSWLLPTGSGGENPTLQSVTR